MDKKIETIVLRHFGNERGKTVLEKANSVYSNLIPLADNESKDRKKNLVNGIYPFVAIYKVLLQEKMSQDEAMEHMFAIMKINTMEGNRKMYQTLGKLPFFFSIFRKMFSTGLKGSSWKVEWVQNDSQAFIYNIKTCLWHDACKSLECPELCQIFCRNDEINFTNVSKHLYFERSQALGYGGDLCDFHFYPKHK